MKRYKRMGYTKIGRTGYFRQWWYFRQQRLYRRHWQAYLAETQEV